MGFFGKKKEVQICLYCKKEIAGVVFDYSTQHFGFPLCRVHQDQLKPGLEKATDASRKLFIALLERNVPAHIEKFDGFKHIDIAIPKARVNIEVDGQHHNYSPRQALSDLQRTLYSFQKGYLTLRIPNSLIHDNLYQAADYIVDFLNESLTQMD